MRQSDILYNLISLEQVDELKFIGGHLDIGSIHVFGGQVLSQAVSAAYKTIHDDKVLHSIHSYFLFPADKDLPLEYEVEVLKRGRSFDTRRVLARQNGTVVFLLAASFHKLEKGLHHQIEMPTVTPPEELQDFSALFENFAIEHGIEPRGIFSKEGPFVFRPVDAYDPFNPEKREPISRVWFKLNSEDVPTKLPMKQSIVTYASDFNLLITALFPHGLSLFKSQLIIASLDHAMWYFQEPDLNDWMLYVVDSPSALNGRALCNGSVYTRNGALVAKVMQEGLIRQID